VAANSREKIASKPITCSHRRQTLAPSTKSKLYAGKFDMSDEIENLAIT
jgi:hypothetical protein